GEFPHLTHEEKLEIIDTVRGNIPTEKLLLVGTSELSTRHTIEMTEKAADRGADGAVVVTPFYYKKLLNDEQHVAHYRRIADNSRIPVIVYLIPQFSGVYLMPETVAELADHPNIIGLKESSGDLPALKDLMRELGPREFNVLLGSPKLLAEGLSLGASGAILAVANIAPRACLEIERAYKWGQTQRAERIQERLTALANATTMPGIGHLKAAMDMVGLYGYLPRSPLPVPSPEECEKIENAIAASGFYDKSEDGKTWVEKVQIEEFEYTD
ncbi:MAG TPA: dihydrodipicolinate synthase family protein, partial [Blastocatellia bacterium]|nr:dihydrodipicolinate synthase family protein [Blastocatellia bacterium]